MNKGIFVLVLIVGIGFFHFVSTGGGFAVVPKASFSFSNTFVSVNDVIEWHNKRSFAEALRGNSQLDNLESELKNRGYIISKKEEVENKATTNKGSQKEAEKTITNESHGSDYSDMKSVILDGNNAVGKTLKIEAEYSQLSTRSGQPYMLVWVGSSNDGARDLWHINFDSRFNSQVRDLKKGALFEIMCSIREVRSMGSECDLIQLVATH